MFGRKKKSPPKQRQPGEPMPPEHSPPKTQASELPTMLKKTGGPAVKKMQTAAVDAPGFKYTIEGVRALRGKGGGGNKKPSEKKKEIPNNLIQTSDSDKLKRRLISENLRRVGIADDIVVLELIEKKIPFEYKKLGIDIKGIPSVRIGNEQKFLVEFEGEIYIDLDLIYNALAEKYPKKKSPSSNGRNKTPSPPKKITKRKTPSPKRKSSSPKGTRSRSNSRSSKGKGPARTRSRSRSRSKSPKQTGKGKKPFVKLVPRSEWDAELLGNEFKYNNFIGILEDEIDNKDYSYILSLLEFREFEISENRHEKERIGPILRELIKIIKDNIKLYGPNAIPYKTKGKRTASPKRKSNNAGEGTSRRNSTPESRPEPAPKPTNIPKLKTGRRRRSKSGTPKKERRRSGSATPKTGRRRKSKSGSPKTGRKEGGAPPKAPSPPKNDGKKEKEDKKGGRRTGRRKSKS